MTSLKESSSAPKLDPSPLNFFANQPSKKSKIEAKTINKIAISHSLIIEYLIDDSPQQRDNNVIVLGRYFNIKIEFFFIIYFIQVLDIFNISLGLEIIVSPPITVWPKPTRGL